MPACQTLANYVFLCLTYGIYQLAMNGFTILFSKAGARCFLNAVIDVEAWYWIYKSYSYTSLTSVQSLDCLAIPVAIIISKFLLHKSYRCYQYAAVAVSIVGVMLIVYSDYNVDDPSNVKGDIMCAVGALLFGVSTVCQEWILQEHTTYQYMGTMCWYAGAFSLAKVGILEREIFIHTCTQQADMLYWVAGLAVSQFIFYSAMPVMLKRYGCGAATINILAADVYAAIAGVHMFSLSYDYIYLSGMAVTCFGILIYTLTGKEDKLQEEPLEYDAKTGSISDTEYSFECDMSN